MMISRPTAVALLLCVSVAGGAKAQVRFDVRLGLMVSTNLVSDSIGTEPLVLRQNLAPTLALALDSRLNPTNRVGVTAAVSRSNLVLHTPGQPDRALLQLTTWTPTIVLTHELNGAFAVSASAGAILYDPDVRLGTIFSGGTPVKPLVGLGLHWRRLLGEHTAMGLDLAYDVHGFMTQTLITQGFSGQWIVHRGTIGVTIGHRNDAPSP